MATTFRYSMEGDPFSATVVDEGPYQGARVYGTIQTIDKSGRFRGHTTMIVTFNRLMMPDGRRAPIPPSNAPAPVPIAV